MIASIHVIFQLTIRRIRIFISLKHSTSQGESSLKISARYILETLGNKQIHTQTESPIAI